MLFCGDLLLRGPVGTHLEGGSLEHLVAGYRRLMDYFTESDRLMPSHNEPWLDKDLLPETLAGGGKSSRWPSEVAGDRRSLEQAPETILVWSVRDTYSAVTNMKRSNMFAPAQVSMERRRLRSSAGPLTPRFPPRSLAEAPSAQPGFRALCFRNDESKSRSILKKPEAVATK